MGDNSNAVHKAQCDFSPPVVLHFPLPSVQAHEDRSDERRPFMTCIGDRF